MRRDSRSFAGAAALLLASCAAVEPQPAPAPVGPAAPPPAVASAPAAPVPSPDPDPAALTLACDGGIELRVRFGEDEATLDGLTQGRQVLGRDAGGTGPQQSVYSGDRVRVEFGLGPTGADADVHLLDPKRTLHCRRR